MSEPRDIVERLRKYALMVSVIGEMPTVLMCFEAATEIARLRQERRWIPVGERLPELNDENHFQFNCLVYCGNGHVCEMIYEINTYAKQEPHRQPRWKWHGMISMWDITHWQPLPPGPETKELNRE